MIRMKHRLGTLVLVGILAACGGGDDDDAGADTPADAPGDNDDAEGDDDTPSDDAPADDGDSDDGDGAGDSNDGGDGSDGDGNDSDDSDDDNKTVITDFDDIPNECVELMGTFLREIEPAVSDIDWENATIEDLDAMGTALDAPSDDFDVRAAQAGCDDFEIGGDDDQTLEFAIQVAQREAPGTVGWLEFISSFSGFADDIASGGDGGDGGSGDGDGGSGGSGDLPTDCDGSKAFVLDVIDEYGTFTAVPIGEIQTMSMVLGTLTSACTIGELEAFYDDPVVSAFLDG